MVEFTLSNLELVVLIKERRADRADAAFTAGILVDELNDVLEPIYFVN